MSAPPQTNLQTNRLRLVESATPWIHELDFYTRDVDAFHIIAIRDDHRQFWHGYVGFPIRRKFDPTAITCHGGPTYVGGLSRKGGRVGYEYVGFYCDQITDYSPRDFNTRNWRKLESDRTYKTLEFVQGQCLAIIAQLQSQQSWPRRFIRFLGSFFKD